MSLTPTSSPSNAPSSSPTECIERIHSSMQKISLGGEVDDWYSTVAVDGSNMVVVATGEFENYNGTIIKFFSLNSDGVWERSTSTDTRASTDFEYACLSGKTAIVAIYDRILVYEQNAIGEWEEVQDPIEFGDVYYVELYLPSCDIDGDLACITDNAYDLTHILHRNGNKWVHFDTKNGSACTIFGDTFVIEEIHQKHLFKYNEIQNALSPIQDPIFSQSCNGRRMSALSNAYLAFGDDCDAALYIYRFDPENETYIFHQQLNMEGVLFSGYAYWIGMDNDVLAVAGFNETFIFVDQDGTWVESLSIVDGHFKALSDRNAIFVSDGEVRAYNILEDCTHSSAPSSTSPTTTSPTYSLAPSVSLSPSTSSSPTYCTKMVQLDLEINDPQDAIVAVDGSNLVVAVRDGNPNLNAILIQFYLLVSSGEWTRSNSSFQFDTTKPYDVALSGNTALVSFLDSPPLVFEQSSAGEWGIVSEPFVFRDNVTNELWLESVDVDGDLACLSIEGVSNSLFRRNGSKWTEFHNFPLSYDCVLSNGTIAVEEMTDNNHSQIQLYEINEGQDAVLPVQDPIILDDYGYNRNLALSHNYLVYYEDGTVFVYQRNSINQTYIFHQKLAKDGAWDLSLYENTLVVAASNQTRIFSEQNGSWVELTVLDQQYMNVAVSGQNLITTTWTYEVHSYNLQNIEDCMAHTPTPLPAPSPKPQS